MGYVKSSNNNNYFYVKKHNQLNVLESSYVGSFVKMDDNIIEKLYPLYQKFAKNHYSVVPELEGYYLTNIFSGECLICLDYTLIYEGDTHVAYNKILRLFELQDNKPLKLNRDPFCSELNNKRDFNAIGAPPKPSAKPRRILCNSILQEDKENKEAFSTQHRKTKRIRRQIRTYKNNENNLGPSVPNVNLPASYNINFDLNPSFNSQPTLQPTLYNIPYYTNINTLLPTSIYSQSTFSSTNAIPNSNYISFNISQDQLVYPSIPNDLGQFSIFLQ
ncbi:hypothetical protein RhiirB3_531722 [Rhizophagus irregularis]|nr:hypothetical protein RhiirB3_531722 [Rhizophagus irregularis]